MLSDLPVKTTFFAIVAFATPLCAQTFRLADVPGVGIRRPGKIVITIVGHPSLPASPFAELINAAAQSHGLDPRLVAAVASRESRWNPNAVSPAGACGIMQLMPATARMLGLSDIFDVKQNIDGGARYLRSLLDTFNGDLDLTLAAYNAGPGAVQRYGSVPPFPETRAYVKAVRAAYDSPHLSLRRSTSK